MRSNRQNYVSTPAGSSRFLQPKPRPRTSKRVWNSRLLIVFFVILPVLGVMAIFLQPVRWLFMPVAVLSLVQMWMIGAFLLPGRLILSAAYGLATVFTLVTALSTQPATLDRRVPGFMTTDAPTSVPTPLINYSMTSDTPDPFAVASGSNGSAGDGQTEADYTDANGSEAKSDAEIALENFMERWRRGIVADMVEYTAPSWREAQQDTSQRDAAQQQLFWKFGQKPLVDWRQISSPTGTDASGARTVTVQADINYGGETRTYEYEAITLYENGRWYVDPDSLSSGILKEQATPTPDPNATPTPEPSPTPEPTTDPKLTLYYNKDGGKLYHVDDNCPSVAQKYLPLTGTFKFSELGKHPELSPCDKCSAPPRM